MVDGLSDTAKKDRSERTDAENAKLDKVLADLSELAKKDKVRHTVQVDPRLKVVAFSP